MELFRVQGGTALRGTVAVSGAKNAALPIMAAALALDGPLVLENVPYLADVATLSKVLRALGVTVTRGPHHELSLCVHDDQPCYADYELVRRMRASVCVLGPLLGRRGRAVISLPGGCAIGNRPIDLHLKGLQALGAEIRVERGYVHATAKRLRGAEIYLAGPNGSTVTGTCNVMSAAVFAEGTTTISAAAIEPEVVDLGNCLNQCGANIQGLGTPVIRIDGVSRLHGGRHAIIPDRIEAATLAMAAAITRGELRLTNVSSTALTAVISLLQSAGVDIETNGTEMVVACQQRPRPVDCAALPYPGIPTDVQAQITAFLAMATGTSIVTDKVFPDRFLHVPELVRLGANIRKEGASAVIHGVNRFEGANVMASDLRASAALLLAALAAEGESTIRRIYHLDRGYEQLDVKLAAVGARIERTVDDGASASAGPVPANQHRVDPPHEGPIRLHSHQESPVPNTQRPIE